MRTVMMMVWDCYFLGMEFFVVEKLNLIFMKMRLLCSMLFAILWQEWRTAKWKVSLSLQHRKHKEVICTELSRTVSISLLTTKACCYLDDSLKLSQHPGHLCRCPSTVAPKCRGKMWLVWLVAGRYLFAASLQPSATNQSYSPWQGILHDFGIDFSKPTTWAGWTEKAF